MGWRQWFGSKAHTTDDLIAEAESARAATAPHKPQKPQAAPAGPAAPMDQIADLLRRGQKIAAIKVHRETYGTGLKESKAAVEAIARGGHQTPAPPSSNAPATDALVLRHIDDGNLLEAIKQYRAVHGTGLAESKKAVDRIAAQRAQRGTQA